MNGGHMLHDLILLVLMCVACGTMPLWVRM